MKNSLFHLLFLALLTVFGRPADLFASPAQAADAPVVEGEEVVIRGVVRDRQSRRRLPSVNIALEGTPVGTVSNADGAFELRVPAGGFRRVKFSHIGYASSFVTPDEAGETLTVWMMPVETLLSDVVIYGADPRRVVEEALERVADNYPSHEELLTLFYRETVQKGRRYIGVSEAVLEASKSAYLRRTTQDDRVRLHKGRQLMSQRSRDTLSVKVAGGPNLALIMDIAKDPDTLLDPEYLDDYHFEMEGSTEIDGRVQYVISFQPRRKTAYPLFAGLLYIDRERLAFTRAEFEMDLSDQAMVVRSVLRKKPAGLRFVPLKVAFVASYRAEGGKSVLHYIESTMRAKCDWRKRLFSSVYTTQTEMVVVDRTDRPDVPVSRRESFRPTQIFSDMVNDYDDPDYWQGYNIIPPSESLEHAVERLKKTGRPEQK